ncbi:MAG: hypothetical protein AAB400_00675 [Patescibacteria group bacterium]
MKTMNIVLNKAITSRLQNAVSKKGYNNISEYIRDLLRRDLNLESNDNAHYDEGFLKKISQEASSDIKNKKIKKLTSLNDLLK